MERRKLIRKATGLGLLVGLFGNKISMVMYPNGVIRVKSNFQGNAVVIKGGESSDSPLRGQGEFGKIRWVDDGIVPALWVSPGAVGRNPDLSNGPHSPDFSKPDSLSFYEFRSC